MGTGWGLAEEELQKAREPEWKEEARQQQGQLVKSPETNGSDVS